MCEHLNEIEEQTDINNKVWYELGFVTNGEYNENIIAEKMTEVAKFIMNDSSIDKIFETVAFPLIKKIFMNPNAKKELYSPEKLYDETVKAFNKHKPEDFPSNADYIAEVLLIIYDKFVEKR